MGVTEFDAASAERIRNSVDLQERLHRCTLTTTMKAMHRETRPAASISPTGRIRKSSAERKEKLKVESTLRRLVGSDEDSSQLELVLSAIRYIRELQSQLENNKENELPDDLQELFAQCSVAKTSSA